MPEQNDNHKQIYKKIVWDIKNISAEKGIREDEAFVLYMLRDVLSLEESIYEDAIQAGGPKDCGIDAFWIDESEKTVYLLQAKYYKIDNKIKEEEIDNFGNSILYLSDTNNSNALNKRCKKYIREKAIEYKECLEKNFNTHLIFVTTTTLSRAAKTKIEVYNNENNQRNIRLEAWDIAEINQQYTANRKEEKPLINFSLSCFYESEGPARLKSPFVVCNLSAKELALAYKKYKGAIFEQNLRYFLRGGRINGEILKTLEDTAKREKFWYYNNGLTIVCDEYKLDREGKTLSVKNMQIVNGAQTTKSIYDSYVHLGGGDSLNNVLVMARIIKAHGQRDLIENIIDYNNKQNPTKPRDFASHKEEQIALQNEFKKLSYFYEIKRGERYEERTAAEIKQNKFIIVDNLTIAQAECAFLGMAAEAKSQKSSLLDPQSEFYSKIFTNNVSASKLLFSYLCYVRAKDEYGKIRKRKQNICEEDEYLLHGTTHIVAIMGMIAKKLLPLEEIFQDPPRYKKIISTGLIKVLYEEAKGYLEIYYGNTISFYRAQNQSLTPSKYFKNSSNAEQLLGLIKKQIDRDTKRIEKRLNEYTI